MLASEIIVYTRSSINIGQQLNTVQGSKTVKNAHAFEVTEAFVVGDMAPRKFPGGREPGQRLKSGK